MKKDSRHFTGPKQQLRAQYRRILASLSSDRRKEAAAALLTSLYPKLEGNVLSFASKDDEIDLTKFNERLIDEGRLLLSRVEGGSLGIYRVTDYRAQLTVSKWYIDEPNPTLCERGSLNEVGCILVPALAFDSRGNRLGYGKGYFDRFLSGTHSPTYGVGFLEQRHKGILPIEDHDVAVTTVYLF